MRVPVLHSQFFRGLSLWLTTMGSAFAATAVMDIPSPFLPAAAAPVTTVTTGGPIELHGYMVTPEGEKFSIYDPAKKSATWVKLNETGYPFVVRSFKTVNSTDQVTVDYQGNTLTLALKQAKIASVTAAGLAGRGGNAVNVVNGRAGPQAPPPVPTVQDAARLQAAAADFQQRQAQRQQAQAALQAGQPVTLPAVTGQQQRGGQRANGGQQQNNNQQGNGGNRRGGQRGQ